MSRTLSIVSVSLILAACADPTSPLTPPPRLAVYATPQELFATYVALGTSNSQGVTSAGINAAGQRSAWPAQLAARVGEVPQDRTIVVVCRSGNRSAQGREILRQSGIRTVTSMAGGMNDWTAGGLPVVTGP